MGLSLFGVARGYLAEMRGVSKFAMGTFLQSIGWILLTLTGIVPAYISEFGSPVIMLAMAFYFHALSEFNGRTNSVSWVYILVGVNLIAIYYFLLASPNWPARTVVASATAAILMAASAIILFFNRTSKRLPVSHTITGYLFLACSAVLVVRAFYYFAWSGSPELSTFERNIVQDIAFLTFFVAAVVSPFFFILMCNDRYMENALLRTQEISNKNAELEEASRVKGQFLATMSHELRTPLNGVIGFLNQLGKTSLDIRQKDYLHTINVSARMLLGVINDVLDFSKIEAGKLSIEKIDIDIRVLLDETISMFVASAEEKGIELACTIDPAIPANLQGDPLRLTQILSNLLANAIKFTTEGEVKLEARLINETSSTVSLQIAVSDTGIGISEQSLSKLFQPFEQADASTTRKYGGTGLGLTIARRLVELMGGRLEVVSKVWQGTCFTIFLELEKSDSAVNDFPLRTDNTQLNVKPLTGKRVLIVDDNNINRKLDQLLIEELGGDFDLAENGMQAVDAFSRKAYDLILMDVNMPVMDGIEATRRIRALESTSHRTPIIALTANALPGDRERFIACGMDEYLSKPLNEKSLLNMLNRWFPLDILIPSGTKAVTIQHAHIANLPALDPKLGVELSMGDYDTWNMVLSLMLDELDDFSQKLAEFSGDMKQLSYWSHKLAGSSCYCGTPVLYQAAKQLEENCVNQDSTVVQISLAYLQEQIGRMKKLDAEGKLRGSKISIY
jgi:signal transduction histidine kinase/DNA-binding NarL/FixJ family response regulator